jgi:hypothetical protein
MSSTGLQWATPVTRYGKDFLGTIRGDPFGLEGVQLDVEFATFESSVTDPIGNFDRALNAVTSQSWSVDLQQDIPGTDWAYGGTVRRSRFEPLFRTHSINNVVLAPFVVAYV